MGVSKDLPLLDVIINKAISKVSPVEIEALNKKWLKTKETILFTEEELDFIKNKTVNLAFYDKWAPIIFSENGKEYGLAFDFWQYIADKANLKTNFIVKNNFDDVLKSIEENQVI